MASEWTSAPLREICKEIYRYPSFYGMEKHTHGVPVVRGEHLLANGAISTDWGDYWFVSDDYAQRFPKTRLQLHDIVMSVRGSIGTFSRVGPAHVGAQISPNLIRLSPDPDRIEPRFLYYALRGSSAGQFINSTSSSSAVPAIRATDIKLAEIPLPPASEQIAIAHMLGTLDDKIELNRRMNETLEAMARTIFKSWFVDFDPVRAKSEGRDSGLPKPIADLFSDRLQHSELGEIPAGWEATRWGALVTLEYGKSLMGYDGENGKYAVYGTNGRIGSHSRPLCKHPGIIIGRKGAYRGVHYCSTPFYVIDTAFYVEPKIGTDLRWAYYELLRQDINSMDSGSAIPSTSREDFYNLPVLLPPLEIQTAFTEFLNPCWGRQEQNNSESRTLAALRNTLLPKLISGQLRVNGQIHAPLLSTRQVRA